MERKQSNDICRAVKGKEVRLAKQALKDLVLFPIHLEWSASKATTFAEL